MKTVVFPTYEQPLGTGRLFSRYSLPQPKSLLKLDGVWHVITSPSQDQTLVAEKYYQGGRTYVLTDEEAADLPPQYVAEVP